jgi:hypothetical protein
MLYRHLLYLLAALRLRDVHADGCSECYAELDVQSVLLCISHCCHWHHVTNVHHASDASNAVCAVRTCLVLCHTAVKCVMMANEYWDCLCSVPRVTMPY